MVVTATKTEQPIDRVTASVRVITEADIARMGAKTLKDIFKNTPGLILQYGTFPSGSAASKSSVNIRGVGATGSLWLIDGRRLAGEVKNPYDMDRIPASMIERIEIVKGPMSALYGADAVGGVINIITKQPKDGFDAIIGLSFGSNSDGDGSNRLLNASVRGGYGQFRGSFYVSQLEAGDYAENEATATKVPTPLGRVSPSQHPNIALRNIRDSYNVGVTYREQATVNTVGGRGEYDVTNEVTVGVEFNWFDEERNGTYRGVFHPTGYINPANNRPIPAFDVPVNSTDNNERLDVAADINYDITDYLDVKFRVYKSRYKKRNVATMKEYADFGFQTEAQSASGGMSANVDIKSYELSANWQVHENHLLTGGVEHRSEKREANVFTQRTTMTTREVSYQALYLQNDFSINDTLRFTVGGRYDIYNQHGYTDDHGLKHNSKSDSESTFRVGMVKNLDKMINLRLSVAQGY